MQIDWIVLKKNVILTSNTMVAYVYQLLIWTFLIEGILLYEVNLNSVYIYIIVFTCTTEIDGECIACFFVCSSVTKMFLMESRYISSPTVVKSYDGNNIKIPNQLVANKNTHRINKSSSR